MQLYIGAKLVNAEPMNREDYNVLRGWELPADEDGTDEGYLVEYLDGGKPNHPDHKGYISWSPKEQFDNGYKELTDKDLDFGGALELLKLGKKVARKGWNGKGLWVGLVQDPFAICFEVEGDITKYENNPYLVIKSVDGKLAPWAASQTDALAEDWEIVS